MYLYLLPQNFRRKKKSTAVVYLYGIQGMVGILSLFRQSCMTDTDLISYARESQKRTYFVCSEAQEGSTRIRQKYVSFSKILQVNVHLPVAIRLSQCCPLRFFTRVFGMS